tara:strand:- start:430 stop:1026 length:597 start_codon:yes stop_codon:yes gene_type:complete
MDLPIFPLNGAVLFPGTSLPLNIFEPRYVEMVDFALSKKRLIGMIQSDKNGKLYKVGCVGKIHSFNETSDGRYLISLQGINCFRVVDEIKTEHKFKLFKVNVINDIVDETNDFSKNQKIEILKKYKHYINLKNINLDLDEIDSIELSQLIKFIAMISPFKDNEKQVLLESQNLKEFYNKLISIIELEIAEGDFNQSLN